MTFYSDCSPCSTIDVPGFCVCQVCAIKYFKSSISRRHRFLWSSRFQMSTKVVRQADLFRQVSGWLKTQVSPACIPLKFSTQWRRLKNKQNIFSSTGSSNNTHRQRFRCFEQTETSVDEDYHRVSPNRVLPSKGVIMMSGWDLYLYSLFWRLCTFTQSKFLRRSRKISWCSRIILIPSTLLHCLLYIVIPPRYLSCWETPNNPKPAFPTFKCQDILHYRQMFFHHQLWTKLKCVELNI